MRENLRHWRLSPRTKIKYVDFAWAFTMHLNSLICSVNQYLDFFVQFYGWFQSEEWLHAIMEYCEYGDLRQYLQQHGKLPEAEVQDITRQILVGVSLMHNAGFAHRDIKPAVRLALCLVGISKSLKISVPECPYQEGATRQLVGQTW